MNNGLDNVVAAHTVLSQVDGAKGELVLRGFYLEQLAEHTVESVAELLWHDLAPATDGSLQTQLGQARQQAFEQLEPLWPLLAKRPVMSALTLGLAALQSTPDVADHLLATGGFAVLVAGLSRQLKGHSPLSPDVTLDQVTDLLRMRDGRLPSAAMGQALNTYLVTVSEHGMNASTFTSRVIASTHADLFASLLGALGALKGPLHGGAPGPVLDMLDAIGTAENSQSWLQQKLSQGERLMGFGHRIYQVRDPRADVLKQAVRQLQQHCPESRIGFAEQVEAEALAQLAAYKPNKRLDTNVEFYTALLLESLGFDRSAFTAVFALGRVVGWCAHYYEQRRYGRLLRPQSTYVGPLPVNAKD